MKIIDFEKQNGSVQFLKTALSALNRLLVAKDIFTKEELQKALLKEMNNYDKVTEGVL